MFRKNKDKESCARCEKPLGIRKSKPEIFWKFDGNLCNDCHSFAEKFTKYYDCRYIDGNPHFTAISLNPKGKIILVLFDNKNDFIFTNKKNEILIDIPIASISSCKIESKSEKSLKKQLLTAGISKTNESRYLRIEYFSENTKQQQQHYMLFDLDDKLEIVNTTINKFISKENNNFVDQTFLLSKQQQQPSSSQKPTTTTSLQPSISSSSPLHQQQQQKSDTSDDLFNYEYPDDDDEGDDDYNEITTEIKRHCKSCNHLNDIDSQFCSRCGKQLVKYEIDTTKPVNVIQIEGSSSIDEKKEKVFFKEKGELVLKRVEHRGSGRKIASWLVAGPIGYVLIGRDKTKNHKMKGTLTITDKAIYCSGNVYPYDHIGVISREKKSLILILDKQLDDDHFSVTLYLKTGNLKKLAAALENARTSHLS